MIREAILELANIFRKLAFSNIHAREKLGNFSNRKSEWHPELDEIQPATRSKLRQVLFKMLREAELLTANNLINAAMLTPKLMETILLHNKQDILIFPMFESDLKGWK